jgi:septal ring factor EnvC (AmiA/AmiB activator)
VGVTALLALCVCTGANAKPEHPEKPVTAAPKHHTAKPHNIGPTLVERPPAAPSDAPLDLSHAVPLDQSGRLPSTSDRYQTLQSQIRKNKPAVENAKTRSQRLADEAARLKKKLIDTAARVQKLEAEKGSLDSAIAELSIEGRQMEVSFQRDRVKVGRLLAVLERLQHDMPPVIVLKSDDALGATHGAMLLGASLPRIYEAAASLSRRLEALRKTRAELQRRRTESARNAVKLSQARGELDQLLAIKEREAQAAQSVYGDLQSQLDTIAGEAADLGSLLAKVAALRSSVPATQNVVVVGQQVPGTFRLDRGSLRRPVVGRMLDASDPRAANMSPGVTFLTSPGTSVVAPADCRVLFAGRYHKTGEALILEMPGGYDLVLAGMDRFAVRTGDQLLAGEPIGAMPLGANGRLYFEVRQNGKSFSPAPWLDADLKPDLRKAKKS